MFKPIDFAHEVAEYGRALKTEAEKDAARKAFNTVLEQGHDMEFLYFLIQAYYGDDIISQANYFTNPCRMWDTALSLQSKYEEELRQYEQWQNKWEEYWAAQEQIKPITITIDITKKKKPEPTKEDIARQLQAILDMEVDENEEQDLINYIKEEQK